MIDYNGKQGTWVLWFTLSVVKHSNCVIGIRVDQNSPGFFVVHRVREGGANLNYHMYLVLYLYCPCLNMVYIIALLSYALDTPCAEQHPLAEAQY